MHKISKILLTLSLGLSLTACKKKSIKDKTTSVTNQQSKTKSNKTTSKKTNTIKPTTSKKDYSENYEKVGSTVYFGYYPQKLETDSSKISSIEELITPFSSTADAASKGWIKQVDYAGNATREAYYYRDIDLDKDGTNDYRAIHIYKYKNYNTSQTYDPSSVWWHDKEAFPEGSTYYFKYEKIKWSVLEEKDGKAYLFSSLALDAMYYEDCTNDKTTKYSHNGGNGYANNYQLSEIRKWLNETFYNLAFSTKDKTIINQTTVKNGLSSTLDTSNDYVCNSTDDFVYLLSEKEITTYYPTTENRTYTKSILSDYAKIQDADYQKVLLRSPNKDRAYDIKYIANESESSYGIVAYGSANYALYAIRPVIVITL